MVLLKFAHTFCLVLLALASFFVGTAITLCFVPLAKNKSLPFRIAASLWSRFLIFFSGSRVSVSGLENIPKNQPMILVVNHQGTADIPIVLATLPVPFRFAVKKDLFRFPFFGWYMKKAGYFPIDRRLILSAYKTVEYIIEILKDGESVLIFPEGTRSLDGSLGKFKRGSLMAALKARVPIVPVALSGSFEVMPRGTKLISPAKVKVCVGQPIYIRSEEEYDQKVEEVRTAIARMMP